MLAHPAANVARMKAPTAQSIRATGAPGRDVLRKCRHHLFREQLERRRRREVAEENRKGRNSHRDALLQLLDQLLWLTFDPGGPKRRQHLPLSPLLRDV